MMRGKALSFTPKVRANLGVTPCIPKKARVNASGELYPYLIAISITFTSPFCKSNAARVNRLRLIYSDRDVPTTYENTRPN